MSKIIDFNGQELQSNSTSRIIDANGNIIASSTIGEVFKKKKFQRNINEDSEMLLPTGLKLNSKTGQVEKHPAIVRLENRHKADEEKEKLSELRPIATDEEPMLPLGIKIEE